MSEDQTKPSNKELTKQTKFILQKGHELAQSLKDVVYLLKTGAPETAAEILKSAFADAKVKPHDVKQVVDDLCGQLDSSIAILEMRASVREQRLKNLLSKNKISEEIYKKGMKLVVFTRNHKDSRSHTRNTFARLMKPTF